MPAPIQEALALAKSDVVRVRVEKASLCAYRAAVSASSMKLTYRDGVCYPDLAEFGLVAAEAIGRTGSSCSQSVDRSSFQRFRGRFRGR